MKLPPELTAKILQMAAEQQPAAMSSQPVKPKATPAPIGVVLSLTLYGVSVKSEANTGGRRDAAIARKLAIKQAVRERLPVATGLLRFPATVTLTRLGAKRLDSDNLAHAFKAVRDVVAEWLGHDDNDEAPIRWEYQQEPDYKTGIRITVS